MEVMITIVILSFGLVLIIRSFMMSLDALRLTKDYTTASLLIEEKLWEFQRLGYIDTDLDEQGEFPEPNNKFKYRLETQKIGEPEEEDGLNNVRFTVNWQQGTKTNNILVETFLKNAQE